MTLAFGMAFRSAVHGGDGEQFVSSSLLLLSQAVLPDSGPHAAVLWGVTRDFSNEPFLLPAAPLALKPGATSPAPPLSGFSQPPCS